MRGPDVMRDTLFAVRNLDSYLPADHPLLAQARRRRWFRSPCE